MSNGMREFGTKLKSWIDGETVVFRTRRRVTLPHHRARKRRTSAQTAEQAQLSRFEHMYRVSAVFICVCIVGVLLYTVFQLPLFGRAQNPSENEVSARYVEKGTEETGAVNTVAGMILDYRAFDTFGESNVLFLAASSVMILLLRDRNNISREEDLQEAHEREIERANEDIILKRVIVLLVPCILLFGMYIVLNGHLSPGGGFSGGATMGAGLILFAVSYGAERVRTFFSMKTFRAITTTALLCYACSKAYSFFTGANNLPSHIPLGTPGALFSAGLIFVLDLCVGCVVACTMYGFYALFNRGEL